MVVIVEELALIDCVVDFLAYTGNFAVHVKLADDIWTCLALAEWLILVDWLLRVGDDVLESQWADLHPFFLGLLTSFAEGVAVRKPVEVLSKSGLE